MHEVLVNRLGGLSLPRKSVVRLTDRPDMTLDVNRGRKTTNQQSTVNKEYFWSVWRKQFSAILRIMGLALCFSSIFAKGNNDLLLPLCCLA